MERIDDTGFGGIRVIQNKGSVIWVPDAEWQDSYFITSLAER